MLKANMDEVDGGSGGGGDGNSWKTEFSCKNNQMHSELETQTYTLWVVEWNSQHLNRNFTSSSLQSPLSHHLVHKNHRLWIDLPGFIHRNIRGVSPQYCALSIYKLQV